MLLIINNCNDVTYVLYIEDDVAWLLQDATFEKMGALMAQNKGRLLGLYDELSSFLSKINVYHGRGLTDTHELALFLELYNANSWTRSTGMYVLSYMCIQNTYH